MNDQVIEERKESLSKYMNELVLCYNIFGDPDVCNFIAMKDKDFMWKHFKSLYEYQETLLRNSSIGSIGPKISDVSEKSGGTGTSEDTNNDNKSPAKAGAGPQGASPIPLKTSFSQSKITSNVECEQKVLDLLDALEND